MTNVYNTKSYFASEPWGVLLHANMGEIAWKSLAV